MDIESSVLRLRGGATGNRKRKITEVENLEIHPQVLEARPDTVLSTDMDSVPDSIRTREGKKSYLAQRKEMRLEALDRVGLAYLLAAARNPVGGVYVGEHITALRVEFLLRYPRHSQEIRKYFETPPLIRRRTNLPRTILDDVKDLVAAFDDELEQMVNQAHNAVTQVHNAMVDVAREVIDLTGGDDTDINQEVRNDQEATNAAVREANAEAYIRSMEVAREARDRAEALRNNTPWIQARDHANPPSVDQSVAESRTLPGIYYGVPPNRRRLVPPPLPSRDSSPNVPPPLSPISSDEDTPPRRKFKKPIRVRHSGHTITEDMDSDDEYVA